MPFIAGNESAGEVIAVGPGVTDLKVGDRVAYVGPLGGYAAERVFAADRAVKLPDNITYEQAAGMMLKGMTVQYLLNRTYKVGKGTIVLIHAAAGGVGLIALPMGQSSRRHRDRHRRLEGEGRARQEERRAPHHPLSRRGFRRAKVKEITSGKLCDVVYDGIGKDTFPASLDCLRPLGYFVSFGSASGQIEAFNINILQAKGSLFATRPTLNHYAAKRDDLVAMANDLFKVVGSGAVKIPINHKYALKDAGQGAQGNGRPRNHGFGHLGPVNRSSELFTTSNGRACPGHLSYVGKGTASSDHSIYRES